MLPACARGAFDCGICFGFRDRGQDNADEPFAVASRDDWPNLIPHTWTAKRAFISSLEKGGRQSVRWLFTVLHPYAKRCRGHTMGRQRYVLNSKNLIRFGTVRILVGPQVIELQGLGA